MSPFLGSRNLKWLIVISVHWRIDLWGRWDVWYVGREFDNMVLCLRLYYCIVHGTVCKMLPPKIETQFQNIFLIICAEIFAMNIDQ